MAPRRPTQDVDDRDPTNDSNPPPVVVDDDEPNPIGVPNDYTVERFQASREEAGDIRFRRRPGYTTNVGPIYFDGDEWIPANWTSEQIWTLQQALARVGLLSGSFTRNVWDTSTRNAYKGLLGLANSMGLDADRTLQELLNTAGDEEGVRYTVDENGNVVPTTAGEVVPPLVTKTTDPTALRSVFRKAVIESLGEGWSQEEINKMVAAYNNVEILHQTKAYNMDVAGEGGNINTIPDPGSFAENYIAEKDPMGAQTQEGLGFVNEFMDLIGSPAWGVG